VPIFHPPLNDIHRQVACQLLAARGLQEYLCSAKKLRLLRKQNDKALVYVSIDLAYEPSADGCGYEMTPPWIQIVSLDKFLQASECKVNEEKIILVKVQMFHFHAETHARGLSLRSPRLRVNPIVKHLKLNKHSFRLVGRMAIFRYDEEGPDIRVISETGR
jgi:hypothetical protein